MDSSIFSSNNNPISNQDKQQPRKDSTIVHSRRGNLVDRYFFNQSQKQVKDRITSELGQTILYNLVSKGDKAKLRFLAKTAPDEFKAAITIRTKSNGWSPIHVALQGKAEMMIFMAELVPEELKAGIKTTDNSGNNPLHYAVRNGNTEKVKLLAGIAPEEFKAAIKTKNEKGETPLFIAVDHNDTEMVKLLAEIATDEFKAAIAIRDKDGGSPIHMAVHKSKTIMLKLLAGIAPEEFKLAISSKNEKGETPLVIAVYHNDTEMIRLLAELARVEVRVAITMGDKDGDSPIHLAAQMPKTEMVKLLAEIAPEALTIMTEYGESVLDMVKKLRPKNYKDITKLYKNDIALSIFRQYNKELVKRKALSHSWHIKGSSELINSETGNVMAAIDLESHYSEQWFHMMSKDLSQFNNLFSDNISENEIALLKDVLGFAADFSSHSLEEKLKRIKEDRLPTMIPSGFSKHAVTLLIWGDQFVICNRGAASRRPIEVYHFDSKKFDSEILHNIAAIAERGSEKDYEEYFFNTLPGILKFTQTDLDLQLQEANPLPNQTVGNCSFVSPTTARYAFLLLAGVLREKDGRLINEIPESSIATRRIENVISFNRTLLADEQMVILKRLTNPLETEEQTFKPDHKLIMGALRKAYLMRNSMELDEKWLEELKKMTSTYLDSFSENDNFEARVDLAFWDNLPFLPWLS